MARKTYTISAGKPPTRGMRVLAELRHVWAGEMRGAVAMAKALYGDFAVWVTDDETGEIIERVEPRKVHLN